MPPVATRRGRPVMSSGTLETPEAGARRSEVSRSDIVRDRSRRAETGKQEHRQAGPVFNPRTCGKSNPSGAGAAYFGCMRSIPGRLAGSKAIIFCCAVAVVILATPAAEARPTRHRKPTPFSVALQPFMFARSVVHAAAAPIVH